ncbi:MAG: NAD(P)-binding domain-containing protein [Brevibacillus sp.]|nr:NAD(P)-binding domain-containing protein [Brevibacillus sp.]
MTRDIDVVVIGAGQAGLAVGYYLRQQPFSYLLLDSAERAGDSWRRRYDSLVLFTPRWYSSLPGYPFPGRPESLPTKQDVADYLEAYARHFAFPIRWNTTVQAVTREGEFFLVKTREDCYRARSVVVATGAFQKPYIPPAADCAAASIRQIHSASYRSEADLLPGSVLVVGSGNTGVQLATELSRNRTVYLSMGEKRPFLPLYLLNKSIFWWFDRLSLTVVPVDSRLGKWLSRKKDPIFGLRTSFQESIRQGRLIEKPKVKAVNGTDVLFADGSTASVQNILWCTGFTRDDRWIQIPGVTDAEGRVVHHRGVSPIPGLFFIGLPWQYNRKSALLGGVGHDAAYLTDRVKEWLTWQDDDKRKE